MGRPDAQRYCCSGNMIADLAAERLLVAFSVVGSYGLISSARGRGLIIIAPEDLTLQLIRTALVPTTAKLLIWAAISCSSCDHRWARPRCRASRG
ncbi:MAG: hypothetical protein WBP18_08315 [Paracoccaceae bacterium]